MKSVLDNSRWHPGFSAFGSVPSANANDSESDEELTQEATMSEEELSQDSLDEFMADHASDPDETESQLESSGEESTALSPRAMREDANEPLADQASSQYLAPVAALPFNLLGTSELDITLFCGIGTPTWDSSSPASYSRVVCKRALQQKMPPGLHHLSRIERLNMVAEIPELGVIAIGNQAGRVGILTMTRWQRHQLEGFRIECILPFKSQEEKGVRPKKPLMGIAISPIQGQANPPEPGSAQEASQETSSLRKACSTSRRYRLLIVYGDHTVLSYELSQMENSDILIV